MGLFDFKKRDRIIDFSEKYNQVSDQDVSDSTEIGTAEERRRKLVKRISDMANKIDEISNSIYHLSQRIEVLEKKARVGSFDN